MAGIDARICRLRHEAAWVLGSEWVKLLLCHPEYHVALECPGRSRHLNPASGRSGRYCGLDFGVGNDFECCACAVEGYACGALQVVSKDNDFGSHLAGGTHCFHK